MISSNNYQSQESILSRINANEMLRPTIATAIVPSTIHTIANSKPYETAIITKSNKIRAKDFFKSIFDTTLTESPILVLSSKDDIPIKNSEFINTKKHEDN